MTGYADIPTRQALPGTDRRQACPVCACTHHLAWLWEGQGVRGCCPDGHARWIPHLFLGAPVGELVTGAAAGVVR